MTGVSTALSSNITRRYHPDVLVFLDESFRPHKRTRDKFGVLAGITIPEDLFHRVQLDVFNVRQPYHGKVLGPEDELKGRELLGAATFKALEMTGVSYQWNLATELLQYAVRQQPMMTKTH
jgi:hypothetical protein